MRAPVARTDSCAENDDYIVYTVQRMLTKHLPPGRLKRGSRRWNFFLSDERSTDWRFFPVGSGWAFRDKWLNDRQWNWWDKKRWTNRHGISWRHLEIWSCDVKLDNGASYLFPHLRSSAGDRIQPWEDAAEEVLSGEGSDREDRLPSGRQPTGQRHHVVQERPLYSALEQSPAEDFQARNAHHQGHWF